MRRWLLLILVLLAAAAPQARGYAQVLEEHVSLNAQPATLSRVYTYGLDLISQREAGGTVYYFIYDGHGSTRALTTTNAAVANVFAYDAYGTLIASNGVPQTVYLFAGEQWDANLGFYYLRARYLNTGTGRFWTRDSFEGNQSDPLSLHKYLYCHANPVNGIDPSGHDFIQTMATIGVIATLAGNLVTAVNIALTTPGGWDANTTEVADSGGYYLSVRGVAASRGFMGTGGFDLLYYIPQSKWYISFAVEAGFSPLSVFGTRRGLSVGVTTGLFRYMNSPKDWSGADSSSTFSLAGAKYVLPRLVGKEFWGYLMSVAAGISSGNSAVVELGMSTSGVQYAGIGYFSSLSTAWSSASTPIPVEELASKSAEMYDKVRSFISSFGVDPRVGTASLDNITTVAQATFGE